MVSGSQDGTRAGGSVGYARFVSDHFAFGPACSAAAPVIVYARTLPMWVGGGLQMLAELPLGKCWSCCLTSEVDYRYDRMSLQVWNLPPRVRRRGVS